MKVFVGEEIDRTLPDDSTSRHRSAHRLWEKSWSTFPLSRSVSEFELRNCVYRIFVLVVAGQYLQSPLVTTVHVGTAATVIFFDIMAEPRC